MKYVIPAAVAFGVLVGGIAQAQTTTPGTPGGTAPGAPTVGAPVMGTGVTGAPPAANAPNRPSTSPSPAAVTTTSEPSRTTAAPVAGANSYTEGQARAHIEEKGFGQVTDLKKDDKGVWRGTAMKDGKSVTVALDYQGNVVSQ